MQFVYKARTEDGRLQKGVIEASTRRRALDTLEKYNLKAIFLKEQKFSLLNINLSFGRSVSKRDLVVFTRQFATMLKSAISPLEALRTQVSQTGSRNLKEKLLKISEKVETGSPLSETFALFPKVFNPFFINIIKAGEATGKLADSLIYLSEHLEREYNFNQKVKGAMFYPLFVVAVFIGAGLIISFFIVPKLTEILKTFRSEDLPLATRALMVVGDFIQKGGWIALPFLLIGFFVGGIFLFKSKKARKVFDKYSLKLPLLGDFFKKIQLSRFAENLSVLLSSGISIVRSIEITTDIISNSVYKNILEKAGKTVSQGEQLSVVLKKYPKEFPPFATQMVLTGERAGELSAILLDLTKFYQGEIERTTERLTTLLEPIMLLILGVAIAVLAFAVFVPLFNLGLGGIG